MKIEQATPEQAEEISKLRITVITEINAKDNTEKEMVFLLERNTPEMIKQKIEERAMYCMIDKDKIVGNIEAKGNEISGLYVLPSKLRKGIGRKLLEFLEEEAKKLGIKKLHLQVTPYALPFYEKMGYKLIKEEKRMINGEELTRRYMEKEL